jgi:beta-phosphoglucomutase
LISAVIFDFDGVLADTEGLHFRALQLALGERGWNLAEPDYWDRYSGHGTDRDAIERFNRERSLGLTTDQITGLVGRKVVLYRTLQEQDATLFPQARPCIERLRPHFPLAIASGSLHAEIDFIVNAAKLADAFGAIVGADDVARAKPAPDLYLEAARRLGVDPKNAVAIEDSKWGLESARAAGLRTIGIATSLPAEALRGHAERVITSLDEVTREWLSR